MQDRDFHNGLARHNDAIVNKRESHAPNKVTAQAKKQSVYEQPISTTGNVKLKNIQFFVFSIVLFLVFAFGFWSGLSLNEVQEAMKMPEKNHISRKQEKQNIKDEFLQKSENSSVISKADIPMDANIDAKTKPATSYTFANINSKERYKTPAHFIIKVGTFNGAETNTKMGKLQRLLETDLRSAHECTGMQGLNTTTIFDHPVETSNENSIQRNILIGCFSSSAQAIAIKEKIEASFRFSPRVYELSN